MSQSGLFTTRTVFFLIFLVELCRLFEILGLKYSSGTGYLRYSCSSRCPGLLSGARDAERPTSSKFRHDCRLPRGPGVLNHSKERKSMQSEVSGLTAMVEEIRNDILPNAPQILPCVPFAALHIEYDLSSLHSTALPAPF
jgi:hypothetical protein